MRQKPSQRLQTVLKLAKLREQAAAEKLAQCIRDVDMHSQQETQLQLYKNEYCNQFKTLGVERISAAQVSNFQRFYTNLEEVETTQQERLRLAESQCEQARLKWQQQYSRQTNMQILVDKKQQQEERELDNKLQREQDDRKNIPLRD
jgi:flagellar FliJ protein